MYAIRSYYVSARSDEGLAQAVQVLKSYNFV